MIETIPVKLAVQQRVFPAYRSAFFDLLARSCEEKMSLFYGQPRPEEALGAEGVLQAGQAHKGENVYLGSGQFYACYQRGLVTWLEAWQPDVLIVEANPRYLNTPKAVNWMKERGRPVIGWGLGAPPSGNFWKKILRERFLAQFQAMITYSQVGASQYRKAGFPAEKIFIAPNAASPRPLQPCPQRPDHFPGRPVVLFVGRLQPRKRVHLLIRACARLPEALQPRLVVVGDGPVKSDLESLAQQVYPLTEFVGERRGADLAPYWQMADLFVLPGTGGLAVQEAMSAGLPVIVAEADGTQADLVRDENGWSLIPGDEEDLASRLAQALSDPVRLRAMGRAGYRIVAEEINIETMVSVFAQAIQLAQDASLSRAS